MIERYTRPEMGRIWSEENRFQALLQVEIAVAQTQAELGIIPAAAARDIAKKSKFKVERIHELEATTKHDVIAFVSAVAENVGPNGRYIHFGMTSSDVLDTALSVLIREAGRELLLGLNTLEKTLSKKIGGWAELLCAGRTHGMHAEPTTFGFKMAGYLEELKRNKVRIENALKQTEIAKLSGAVGTYSSQPVEVEERVAAKLKLTQETVATQVVPRDRHAELFMSLAIYGSGLERLAVELRHLQRTEVGEVKEGFSSGQKGSSAMPHKRNPIAAENLTGVARLLRSYAQAALENIALWHERDISHSSVERVIFPDAFILADYATHRMNSVISQLEVDSDRMVENLQASMGQIFSSHALLLLVEKGLSREEAYKLVQSASHNLKKNENLKEALWKDKRVKALVTQKELDQVFSGVRHRKAVKEALKRVQKEGGR